MKLIARHVYLDYFSLKNNKPVLLIVLLDTMKISLTSLAGLVIWCVQSALVLV